MTLKKIKKLKYRKLKNPTKQALPNLIPLRQTISDHNKYMITVTKQIASCHIAKQFLEN
jgi:hypothetical protein